MRFDPRRHDEAGPEDPRESGTNRSACGPGMTREARPSFGQRHPGGRCGRGVPRRRVADRQDVPRVQGASAERSDAAEEAGRPAAVGGRHLEAAANGERRAGPDATRPKAQPCAGRHLEGHVQRHRDVVDGHLKARPGHRADRRLIGLELGADQA